MPARAAVRDDLATDRPLAAQAGSETAIPSVTRTPSVPRSSHMGALACPSAVAARLSATALCDGRTATREQSPPRRRRGTEDADDYADVAVRSIGHIGGELPV